LIVFDDNETVVSLFQDVHKLKGGEATSDLQIRKPSM
jgi:hypothetical protein